LSFHFFQDYERHDGKHHSKHSLDKHLLTDHPLDGNEKYLHNLGKMASDNAAAGLTNGASEYISKIVHDFCFIRPNRVIN
jgi:hypothetical protein